eukprot:jgi/Chlat1/6917/Chrsp52S06596
MLRARAFYEGQPYLRFVDSFIQRFAEQEARALTKRLKGTVSSIMRCTCFIAVQHVGASEEIIGSVDVSLRRAPGHTRLRLLETLRRYRLSDDAYGGFSPPWALEYAYMANMCTAGSERRRGIASHLLKHALDEAALWGMPDLYAHVAVRNGAARALYEQHGFVVLRDFDDNGPVFTSCKLPAHLVLDQTLLLWLDLQRTTNPRS